MKSIPYFLLAAFLLTSCQWKNQNEFQRIVYKWQGRKIRMPRNEMQFKIMGRDTLCVDLWNKPYKIFTYVDSIGCTSCQLGLPKWKELIDSCILQQMNVSFLFVVHSNDYEEFERALKIFEFSYPIIYDYKNDFEKLNHFPPAPFRTFLLGKDNKVEAIGTPVDNPALWELYKKIINSASKN